MIDVDGFAESGIDLTEMDKLRQLLLDNGIPFEERVVHNQWFHNYQICYPSAKDRERKSDVVIGVGTYGSEEGLLEQMGLLPNEDALDDDVQGWLDAETVFRRWAEDFGFFVKGMNI